MTRADGVRRVTDLLDAVCDQAMMAPDGHSFRVSFSAGVSEYGVDGAVLRDLCRRADEALYVAKALGRRRVLAAGERPSPQGEDGVTDVVVVEDDDIVAELLTHGLARRVGADGGCGDGAGGHSAALAAGAPPGGAAAG